MFFMVFKYNLLNTRCVAFASSINNQICIINKYKLIFFNRNKPSRTYTNTLCAYYNRTQRRIIYLLKHTKEKNSYLHYEGNCTDKKMILSISH